LDTIVTFIQQLQYGLLACLLAYLITYLLTYSLTPWCSTLFEKLTVSQLVKKTAFFMELEILFLLSKKPAIGPYPEPAETNNIR
jgi:hypothetical protein